MQPSTSTSRRSWNVFLASFFLGTGLPFSGVFVFSEPLVEVSQPSYFTVNDLSLSSWSEQSLLFTPEENHPSVVNWNQAGFDGTLGDWRWSARALAAFGADSQVLLAPNPWVDADLSLLSFEYSKTFFLSDDPLKFDVSLGRFRFWEPTEYLLDQPLDGTGFVVSQGSWKFYAEAGWDGWLSKRLSRMNLSMADQDDRSDSSQWWAPQRGVFSAWEEFQMPPRSQLDAGILWQKDFRSSSFISSEGSNYLVDGAGDYSAKYAWAKIDNEVFLPFSISGVWEFGTTVLYNLNTAQYEYFPVQAWSAGGDLGSSEFSSGLRLRFIFRVSSGDSSERQGFAEGSPTSGDSTNLFRPPDADPFSRSFPADPGNLQWYGFRLDGKGSDLPFQLPLLFSLQVRGVWRTLLGPIGYPENSPPAIASQDYYLGWGWDDTLTWLIDQNLEADWNVSWVVPNPSSGGYWQGQAPLWQAATSVSVHWEW